MINSYPKRKRLITRYDFNIHRLNSFTLKSRYFIYFISKNSKLSSRLGLKISKKAGGSVCRNMIKRVLRESFRCSSINDLNLDIVIAINHRSFKKTTVKKDLMSDACNFFASLNHKL